MKKLKWNLITLNNPDFNCTYAYGSVQLNSNSILLFGGSKTDTFILDTGALMKYLQSQKDSKKPINDEGILIHMKNSSLCTDAWFNYESDYGAKIYGNYLYSLD